MPAGGTISGHETAVPMQAISLEKAMLSSFQMKLENCEESVRNLESEVGAMRDVLMHLNKMLLEVLSVDEMRNELEQRRVFIEQSEHSLMERIREHEESCAEFEQRLAESA